MDFITIGDRVKIIDGIKEDTYKRQANPDAYGKLGVVEDEDGWGFCRVRLDDGTLISAWNEKDLTRI